MRRNIGLVAAMENENDPAPGDNPSAMPAEAPAESAETELIDVSEGNADGEASDAAVEEAIEAAATMESIVVGLESFREKGGLNEQGAFFLNVITSHFNGRLGTDTKIPSMESFAAPSSRLNQHRIALESVKDTIARIWKAIKDAIKKSIEWVTAQFNKLFGAAEKLKKRAEALTKVNVTGSIKETTFENERVAKALSINGQAPTDVAAGLSNIKKVGDVVFGSVTDFNAKIAEEVSNALDALDLSKASVAPYSVMNFKPVDSAAAGKLGYADAGEGMVLQSPGELPGNKTVVARVPAAAAEGEAALNVVSKVGANVIAFDSKQKEVSNFKLKTLATGDIEKIAATVVEICDACIAYKAKLPKAKDLKGKLVKAADKAEAAALKEENAEKAKAGKLFAKATHNTALLLDRPAPQFQAYAVNTCKAALDYCDLSIKQYGTK